MQRFQLEHAIRASTQIVQQKSVIVIGSQAILGTWTEDELPSIVTMSDEVDICPLSDNDAEDLATKLDSIAGEFSPFHESHEFYIQGVGRNTAVLPEGWAGRLVELSNENTNGSSGLCLEPHDLCAAKLIALRDKDRVFVQALLEAGMISENVLLERLSTITDPRAALASSWVTGRPKSS